MMLSRHNLTIVDRYVKLPFIHSLITIKVLWVSENAILCLPLIIIFIIYLYVHMYSVHLRR